jgi:phosphatidylglycerophosphate synthase
MKQTWAHVKAGTNGVPLLAVVGGISLALRHARMASRAGFCGVRYLVEDDDERTALAAHLAQRPVPEQLQCKVLRSDEAPQDASAVQLEASALYLKSTLASGQTPTPDFRIENKSQLADAQRFLFAQIRKSIVLDGVIAFFVMRPLARVFTRGLLNTPVSPNQATMMALGCGIGAALFAAAGGAKNAIAAGALYWLGGVLDCIDGELARMRLQSSKIGEWLDSMVDEFSTIALISGLGIGLARDGAGDVWMYMGFAGATMAVLALAPLYIDLHRRKLAIDTAQFPWFFDDKSGAAPDQPPTAVGRVINFVGYFVRRDANLTAIALCLVFDFRRLALGLMLGAFVIVAGLTMTHYAVMKTRKSTTAS